MGTTEKARLHHDLARRFTLLQKKISVSPEDNKYKDYYSERLDIEADEPPVRSILNMMCYNEILRAKGYPLEDQVTIKWYQRLFCHWIDFGEFSIQRKQ